MGIELVDGARGQERVETGEGYVVAVTVDDAKRNNQVQIRANHLQQPVTAWADRHAPMFATVLHARDTGAAVTYRIAVRRKANAPADKTIADLKNTEKVRELDDLALVHAGAAVIGAGQGPQTAATADTRQPPPQAPAAAPAPNPTPIRPDSGQAPANKCGWCEAPPFATADDLAGHLSTVHADKVTKGMPPASTDAGDPGPPEPGGAATGARPATRGPRIEEGRPWHAYNSDGSVNLGSYAFTASIGFTEWAHRLLTHRRLDVAKTTGAPFAPPPGSEVRALARRLLRAADLAQAALRSDRHVDRMDASHTRARGAVREAIDAVPIPWDHWPPPGEVNAQTPELDGWVDELAKRSAGLLTVALQLLDPDPLPDLEARA